MDIVKNLKDYKLTHEQKIFASFLRESIDSYSCSEEITNREFIRSYFAPDNDFTEYTTAIGDPARLIRREQA